MSNLNIRLFITVICLPILLSSCKSRKSAIVTTPTEVRPMEDKSVQDLLFKLDSAEFKADWINAKASVSTLNEGSETSFNISMRCKKDSIIWISISPLLGIEVARIMITTDSIRFIDRLHGKYQVGTYENINKILQLKANFELVQALLYGNFFAYKKNENKFNSVYLEDKYYVLSSLNKKKLKRSLEEKDPNKTVIQDIFIDEFTYRIKRMQVNDQKIDKTLITDYEQFRITDAGLFPFKSTTKVEAEKSFEIIIDYGKVVVGEPQEFPFNVPTNYERIR